MSQFEPTEKQLAMSNVTALFGTASLPINTVMPDVVAEIEHLLERARCGEVRGFAYAMVMTNHDVIAHWASGAAPHNLMISASAQLAHAIASAPSEPMGSD